MGQHKTVTKNTFPSNCTMLYFPVITVSEITPFLPSFVVWYT